ncbi:hypothetical protein G5I_05086 [Acromyrmex echinatior]|uniref:Uncharacterized protein n=1 Tax=Acromyrmex echinatior TaxID=103372 RepID=F4WHC6_ACREC|nr:hypothetical protein G5I_05086 [Acromyrmex echinatior]
MPEIISTRLSTVSALAKLSTASSESSSHGRVVLQIWRHGSISTLRHDVALRKFHAVLDTPKKLSMKWLIVETDGTRHGTSRNDRYVRKYRRADGVVALR